MKKIVLTLCLAIAAPLVGLAQSTQVVVYQAVVSPSNEVPPRPATQQASGNATILMNIKRDASGRATSAFIDFVMNAYFSEEETARAMHIHRGDSNVSGPVVLDSSFGDRVTVPAGPSTFVRRAEFVNTAQLNIIEEVLANPGDFYVNIHTNSAPGGILRGQLGATDEAIDAANGEVLSELQSGAADQKAQLDAIQELVRRVALRVGLRP